LSEAWAEGARYIDPLMAGEGTEEIGQLIAGVQDRFPDFRFSLDGMADSVGSLVRFSWDLDPVIDAPIVKGTDFVTIQDGRISSVVGFIDMAPALG